MYHNIPTIPEISDFDPPMPSPTLEQRLQCRLRPRNQRVVMFQKWRQLLFLHWTIEATIIQKTLPPGLTVDTFAGKAYLGIVPFLMVGIRPRYLPAVPGISHFMETNVRTYVYDERGVPGVWFYSLDANQWLAVRLARALFKLPYYYARMHSPYINFWGLTKQPPPQMAYSTQRRGAAVQEGVQFHYHSAGNPRTAEPGSLEFFLVERYILFATPDHKRLATGQVYHTPYPIHDAHVAAWDDQLLSLNGFDPPQRPPDHVLFSPGVDVDIYPLQYQ